MSNLHFNLHVEEYLVLILEISMWKGKVTSGNFLTAMQKVHLK